MLTVHRLNAPDISDVATKQTFETGGFAVNICRQLYSFSAVTRLKKPDAKVDHFRALPSRNLRPIGWLAEPGDACNSSNRVSCRPGHWDPSRALLVLVSALPTLIVEVASVAHLT